MTNQKADNWNGVTEACSRLESTMMKPFLRKKADKVETLNDLLTMLRVKERLIGSRLDNSQLSSKLLAEECSDIQVQILRLLSQARSEAAERAIQDASICLVCKGDGYGVQLDDFGEEEQYQCEWCSARGIMTKEEKQRYEQFRDRQNQPAKPSEDDMPF